MLVLLEVLLWLACALSLDPCPRSYNLSDYYLHWFLHLLCAILTAVALIFDVSPTESYSKSGLDPDYDFFLYQTNIKTFPEGQHEK